MGRRVWEGDGNGEGLVNMIDDEWMDEWAPCRR